MRKKVFSNKFLNNNNNNNETIMDRIEEVVIEFEKDCFAWLMTTTTKKRKKINDEREKIRKK